MHLAVCTPRVPEIRHRIIRQRFVCPLFLLAPAAHNTLRSAIPAKSCSSATILTGPSNLDMHNADFVHFFFVHPMT